MSPEAKQRALVLGATTLIPIGTVAGIVGFFYTAGGFSKTVEANSREIVEVRTEIARYREDVNEIKVNIAEMKGAMGVKYKIVKVSGRE